jgi:hypothetical protein
MRVLTLGSEHPEHLALAPKHLPAAACRAVVNSLLKSRLLIEVPAPPQPRLLKYQAMIWRHGDPQTCTETDAVTRTPYMLKVTDEGLRAIGIDPNEGDAQPGEPDCSGIEGSVPEGTKVVVIDPLTKLDPPAAPALPVLKVTAVSDTTLTVLPGMRLSLREAAQALLDEIEHQGVPGLGKWTDALNAALAEKRATAAPRAPRADSKQEAVLTMLRRAEGATVAQIAEAMGWQQHTVRGFLAGLKKRPGITLEIADRVRMVGPNKTGAKGSYTVYRVAAQEAGQ